MLFALLVTSLYLAAVLSPGPDFLIICKHAVMYSRRTAILTALGLAVGVALHATYSVFGLGYVMNNSGTWLPILRYLGGGYLIFVGVKGMLEHSSAIRLNIKKKETVLSDRRAFVSGFVCNALNPKAMLFFISVFTFITASQIPTLGRVAFGVEMSVLTFVWFATLSCLITHPHVLSFINRYQHIFIKTCSVLLICIGVYLIVGLG